jgi:hypothetical protein
VSFPEPPPASRPAADDTTVLFGPPEALDSHTATGASGRRGVVTVAVAVLALAAAGLTGAALARGGGGEQAALAASTSSPSASPSAGTDGRVERHGFRGGPGLLGMGGAIHGELVVPDGDGGYRTVVVQRGTASKVGSDTITVTSDDGFTQTYDVPAGTGVGALREGLGSIKSGANVVVMAEKKGGSLTATHVMDLDSLGAGGFGFGHGDGDGDGDGPGTPPGAQSHAPSGSAEGSAYGV